MASRFPRVHLPHLEAPSIDRDRISRAAQDAVSWRPPRGADLRLVIYRTAWAPFWFGSDVPAPKFRVREKPLPSGGPAGDHFAGVLKSLTRRVWLQRALTIFARAAWLPLLVGCIWLLFELGGGSDLNVRVLIALGLLLLVPAAVFAWLVKPSRRQMARTLDRSFYLQERMLTAHENVGKEVAGDGEAPSVTYLQMADAANVITEIRNHPAFKIRPPVREIVLAVVCGLILAALFFMRGVGGGIPVLATDAVPPFVPAAEILALQPEPVAPAEAAVTDAPTVEEVQAMAERSNEAQEDLRRLGDALSDQAATRAASEAIQRGDYSEAADLIRQVGDDADQLSQSARDGLADDLDQAADEMSGDSGELEEATRGAADGLREGGDAANEGMKELGDAVDETASDVVSQQQLKDEMSRATAAEASQSQGEPGEQSDSTSGESQDGSEQQSGSESGEGSQGGPQSEQGQPGEQTGEGESGGQQEGSASSPMDEDNAGPSGSEGQGEPQDGAQPGEGTQPGEATDAQNGESRAEQEGDGGDPGAGAGGSDTQTQTGNETSGGDSSQNPEGEPGDPNVTDAQSGAGDGEQVDPRDALTLPRSPDSEGYQTSSTGGSGSIGSGGPGAASGGSGTNQGDVGAAGPDSNHVPAEYRSIVEAYFSDADDS